LVIQILAKVQSYTVFCHSLNYSYMWNVCTFTYHCYLTRAEAKSIDRRTPLILNALRHLDRKQNSVFRLSVFDKNNHASQVSSEAAMQHNYVFSSYISGIILHLNCYNCV